MVVVSWTIGSIANFMLIFNPLGKHALTHTERWTAITVVTALTGGLGLMGFAWFAQALVAAKWTGAAFIGGLILFTMALPLGDWTFPIRWRGMGRRVKTAMFLVMCGIMALASLLWMPELFVLPALYAGAFILYNWTGLFR